MRGISSWRYFNHLPQRSALGTPPILKNLQIRRRQVVREKTSPILSPPRPVRAWPRGGVPFARKGGGGPNQQENPSSRKETDLNLRKKPCTIDCGLFNSPTFPHPLGPCLSAALRLLPEQGLGRLWKLMGRGIPSPELGGEPTESRQRQSARQAERQGDTKRGKNGLRHSKSRRATRGPQHA